MLSIDDQSKETIKFGSEIKEKKDTKNIKKSKTKKEKKEKKKKEKKDKKKKGKSKKDKKKKKKNKQKNEEIDLNKPENNDQHTEISSSVPTKLKFNALPKNINKTLKSDKLSLPQSLFSPTENDPNTFSKVLIIRQTTIEPCISVLETSKIEKRQIKTVPTLKTYNKFSLIESDEDDSSMVSSILKSYHSIFKSSGDPKITMKDLKNTNS